MLPISATAEDLAVVDFDGDGIPDLFLGNGDARNFLLLGVGRRHLSADRFLGPGNGTFTEGQFIPKLTRNLRSAVLPLLLVTCVAMVMTACGGGNGNPGSTSGGGTTTTGNSAATQTPTGSYPISVVATGPNSFSQTASVSLSVQAGP